MNKSPQKFFVFPGDRVDLCCPRHWPFPRISRESLLQAATTELIGLVGHFGFPFGRSVRLFVFASSRELSDYYRVQAGGVALVKDAAIAIGGDLADPIPIIRHEMAHLFSGAWGALDPPLKAEGMAVWWETRVTAKEHEALATRTLRECMIAGRPHRLFELLDSTAFMAPANVHGCYALAGSFTRWLIGHFGWLRYRTFFRAASTSNFGEAFQEGFGCCLRDSEKEWWRVLMASTIN